MAAMVATAEAATTAALIQTETLPDVGCARAGINYLPAPTAAS